jgi:uncharacterized membrane protein YcaP (DUF421 family)
MDSVLRGAIVYVVLLVLFRLVGKRSLAQITTFDFVLLLIIAEAIQQAMVGADSSMVGSFLLVVTLLGIDVALSLVKQRSQTVDKWLDDVPLVIVDDGKLLHDRMNMARVDELDVLHAARQLQGLERLDQIKYAVLEVSGGISIIPKRTNS